MGKRDLSGARVVLTGASSGIGRAAVPLFADAGARLALIARDEERLAEVAPPGAVTLTADLDDRTAAEGAVEQAASRLGGIDVLVLNAAEAAYGPFRDTPAEEFERTLDSTFGAAVNTTRAALPHLDHVSGTLVANVSVLSRFPVPMFSAYVASKHGLRGFLGSLRIELEHDGSDVEVAMVHPGHVDTPFWSRVSSVTGRLPRLPPLAYDEDRVARALVDAATNPRREHTVGLLARAQVVTAALAMPLVDASGRVLARWLDSGPPRAP
jgi:NAD(P)-dependent dehydrogenase (short-subunit alcohol dehydrogenase family)